jgi:hypothetical protein
VARQSALSIVLLAAGGTFVTPAMQPGCAAQSAEFRLTLLDRQTGEPVSGARLVVTPPGTAQLSTAAGTITLRDLAIGEYVISITAPGYLTWQDTLRVVRATSGATTIRLDPDPIALDPLSAEARRRGTYLDRVGFYSRRSSGQGHFFDREEIERKSPTRVLDLMYALPRSQVLEEPGGRRFVLRSAGGQCSPALFLDGVRVQNPWVLDSLPVATIEAIELYTGGATAPIEWRKDNCGTLLIWTRPPGRG